MKSIKKRNMRRAESLSRQRQTLPQGQAGISPPRKIKEIWKSAHPILKTLSPIEWLGEWVAYCFKASAGLRLVAEFIALAIVVVTFIAFWLEYEQRGIDRGVRIATLFAQIAQVHALPDGKGLKALTPSVEALVRENVPIERIDLNGAVLAQANLSGADLSGADFSGGNLYRANLSGADLSETNLSGANLIGANLSGANLYSANISGTNLIGADLSEAGLYKANLAGANLYKANLAGANLRGADLAGAILEGSILIRTDFEKAKNVPSLKSAFAIPNRPPTNIPEGVEIPAKWVLPTK